MTYVILYEVEEEGQPGSVWTESRWRKAGEGDLIACLLKVGKEDGKHVEVYELGRQVKPNQVKE